MAQETCLIGIMGNGIGAGKTTAAEYLVKEHGFTRVPLAKRLKEAVVALDPLLEGRRHLSYYLKNASLEQVKRSSPELRRCLQRMGTEVGRHCFGEDFWVDLWEKEAKNHPKVVVDDVRFLNETAAIVINGGGIMIVENPNLGDFTHDSHSSEEDWQKVKAQMPTAGVILNDGSKELLYSRVDNYLLKRNNTGGLDRR